MQIDPIIKAKLINEILYDRFKKVDDEKKELTKLALVDILTEDEIKNLYKKYGESHIYICDCITTISKNKYKLNILCQDGEMTDSFIIKDIIDRYCHITKSVVSSSNIITDICNYNKIIGYSIWPFTILFHIDDIRKCL
jgi:hypothetical protein